MKRFLTTLLAMAMLLSCMTLGVFAQESATASSQASDVLLTGGAWSGRGMEMTVDGISGYGNVYTSSLSIAGLLYMWKTDAPIDISGSEYLEFDLYVSDATALQSATLCVELASSGRQDDQEISVTLSGWKGLQNGWNHVQWSLTDDFGSPMGQFDDTNLNFMRVFNFSNIPVGDEGLTLMLANFTFTAEHSECIEHTDTTKDGVCDNCGTAMPGPVISQQPTDAYTVLGENYKVEVKAQGEGLKYQWYFRNAGSSRFYKSSVKTNTYTNVLTKARAGREVYCVITDAYGNSVTTETAKLIRVASEELEIVSQPENSVATLGETYYVSVGAKGEGLKYQWYFRNAGSDKWYRSSVKTNTYTNVMTKARANRDIYCVITDALGNKVVTDVVTLVCVPKEELAIVAQPTDACVAMGETYLVSVEANGDGLKYQWYFRNVGSDKWYRSSVKTNTYTNVMTKARANREVYCVITDAFGNQIATDIAVLTVKGK